ncbi:lymphocyte antigen 75-like isoform X2 [Festucalex cinctus]
MNAIRWLIGQALLVFGACATCDSGCDPDEVPYRGFCYYFYNGDQKKWQDAEDFCLTRKSHLISIHSSDEHRFLKCRLQKIQKEAWIGLTGSNGGNYTFTDETALDENPWPPCGWYGLSISECMKLEDAYGAVCIANCNAANNFICKKARGSAPVPPRKPVWTDDCGWWAGNPSDDFCYHFNNNYWITWKEARRVCTAKGGDLLRIADFKEQAFLQDSLQGSWNETSLWMDGNSWMPNSWQWSDSSRMAYMRWSTGDSHSYNVKRCLSFLAHNGQWEEDDCEVKKGFICKKRKGAKN